MGQSNRYTIFKRAITFLLIFAITAGVFLPMRKAFAADVVTFQDDTVRWAVLKFLNQDSWDYSITQADIESITLLGIDDQTITTFADFKHFTNLENIMLLNCTLPDLSLPENRVDFLSFPALYNFQMNGCNLHSIPDNYFKDYVAKLENNSGWLTIPYNYLGGEWQKSWFDTSMSDQDFQDFIATCNGYPSITLTPASDLITPDEFDNYTIIAQNG
ncbi:hypothetical protein LJC42_08840 [Eubacteriales bacterium OttesenSCG-928-K08]|nr:hypothetical protein [Eubacteriales bacterium OttesenSCG-928-K08]